MHENTEMRAVMASLIGQAMDRDDDVMILDADLAGANGNAALYKKKPERCLNVGVAECNMASVAAGLASYGFKPFIYTFAPFATRRICDQIAVSIVYAGMNVKIVGSDPGLSAAYNGGTHMTMEDVGVMRSLPGMTIFEPTDGDQLAKAFPHILAHEGPMYIRLHRKTPQATFFAGGDYVFRPGKADVLRSGGDVTLFATGVLVKEAVDAAEVLAAQGVSAEVVNIHTIKPVDAGGVVESVRRTGCAVTCENHNIIGGMGSAVAEALAARHPAPVEFVGMKDAFSEVGQMNPLIKKYGMDAEAIAAAALAAIRRKREAAAAV